MRTATISLGVLVLCLVAAAPAFAAEKEYLNGIVLMIDPKGGALAVKYENEPGKTADAAFTVDVRDVYVQDGRGQPAEFSDILPGHLIDVYAVETQGEARVVDIVDHHLA
jgi:hypothetical protein